MAKSLERLNVAIMPTGEWGSAFAKVTADADHHVILGFRSQEDLKTFYQTGRTKRLPDISFPENVEAEYNAQKVLKDADILVLAPPSRFLRSYYREIIQPNLPTNCSILSLTKGLEQETNLRMSRVLEEEEPGIANRLAILSGPNLAKEIAKGLPAATVVASSSQVLAARVQNNFSTAYFRIYTRDDVVGVEYGGAFKNVIALAAGVCDGLGLGENARAALINRGLEEMTRLAVCLGGREQTLRGLSGAGDLWLTCTSSQSKNHTMGVEMAQKMDMRESLESRTVEGFYTAKAMVDLARENNVQVPIAQSVYEVFYEGLTIPDAIRKLLDRDLVNESGAY